MIKLRLNIRALVATKGIVINDATIARLYNEAIGKDHISYGERQSNPTDPIYVQVAGYTSDLTDDDLYSCAFYSMITGGIAYRIVESKTFHICDACIDRAEDEREFVESSASFNFCSACKRHTETPHYVMADVVMLWHQDEFDYPDDVRYTVYNEAKR